MAIEPLMAWRPGFGTVVQAVRVLNGTTLDTSQLGAATGFATSSFDTGTNGHKGHNRIIEFQGEIYAYHNGTQAIYRYDFGGSSWTLVDSLPNPPGATDDNSVTGFELVEVNGEQRLYLFYQQSVSTNLRGRWTSDGTTWNATAIANYGLGIPFQKTLVYEGKVYIIAAANDPNTLHVYDPVADNWTRPPVLGSTLNGRCQVLINFKGRLLLIGPNAGTDRGPIIFKELVGGGFTDVSFSGGSDPGDMVTVQVPNRSVPLIAFEGRLGSTAENGNLYVIFGEKSVGGVGDQDGQMRCHEFIPNGTTPGSSWQENNISSSVIPADWLAGGAFEGTFNTLMCLVPYIQVVDPNLPEIFFWRHRDIQTTEQSTFWTWNGPSSLMTAVNSDVDNTVQGPSSVNGTGEHRYTEGNFDVTLENGQISPGKVSFDFQVHLPLDGSSPPDKQARLWYTVGGTDWVEATLSTAGGDAPITVSGTDAPPTISGNLLQGIPVGSSIFRATWDAAADGFTGAGLQVQLALEVF